MTEARSSSGVEHVGMTLRERMALLNNQTNSNGVGQLGVKPNFAKGPPVPGNKPTVPGNKPALTLNKPKPIGTSGYNSSNIPAAKIPAIDIKIIEKRKQSLKIVASKRESSYPDPDAVPDRKFSDDSSAETNVVITAKNGKRFKKLSFIRKPGKISKPDSLSDMVLAPVQYTDAETGVELRIGGGRHKSGIKSEFVIKSMTEEDEELEAVFVAPALPKTPHPKLSHGSLPSVPSLPGRRHMPPPEPIPDPTAELLYDEGEALASTPAVDVDDGQELYEEFDEIVASPKSSISHAVELPPVPAVSPEDNKKLTKADRDRKKRDKKEQERIQKLRQIEVREQEAIIKRFKITDEELVSSHFVQATKEYTGSGKMMLAVKAKENVALIRKTGCSEGKWLVKNLNTQTIGLVEAANMIDLEEVPVGNGLAVNIDDESDEQIYEELN